MWGMHKDCHVGAWQFGCIATGHFLKEFNGNDCFFNYLLQLMIIIEILFK